MKQIAIIGRCDNTRAHAPFGDRSWEVWGLAWDTLLRVDRLFEIHDHWETGNYFDGGVGNEAYLEWLQSLKCPIYMPEKYDHIPGSVRYPYEQVKELIGGNPYLESSIGYMLALAILEGADRIGLWGVDLQADDEWAYQRPNAEYLIGFARGRGIRVYAPKEATILSSAFPSGIYGIGHGDLDVRRVENSDSKLAIAQ